MPMFPRILCVIFISHGLLAAQSPPATESPTGTEPAIAGPAADDTTQPSAPAVAPETAIIGPIADGTVSPPVPAPPLPNFKIRSTTTTRIMREEPSGVTGLPPVRKAVTATVHLVEDPHLPAPPAPPPPDVTDPSIQARIAGLAAHPQKAAFVSLSATVYDHQRTLLRWKPIGGNPDAEMTAWSNIDFNYMTGFANYTYNGCTFTLLMMVGNESTAVRERAAQRSGRPYIPPVFPVLPADGPGFVVTKGDTGDAQAMEFITGIHELYRVEEARLKAAYAARAQAQVEREAYLRANPPQPQDITIHIWKRDTPAANDTTGKGGNP